MGVRFRLSNSVKSPEIKMGRSYEERVSSYRKTFGPEGGQGRVQETREQVQYSSSNLLNSSVGGGRTTPTGSGTRRVTRDHARAKSSGVTRKDLEQMADAIGPEFVHQRTNEKEELKGLNNRFARYLKRVQDLERENKILEAQLNQSKSRGPSNLAEKYEEELRRLRQMVDKLTHERAQAEMLRDNYANESEQWREKYDEELAQRKDLEADLNQMRKDCDDATLVRVDLERKIETMVEEMEFLKKIHADEIRELKDQLNSVEIKIEAAPGPDLMGMIDEIRAQYEKLAAQNKMEAEDMIKARVAKAADQAAKDAVAIKASRNKSENTARLFKPSIWKSIHSDLPTIPSTETWVIWKIEHAVKLKTTKIKSEPFKTKLKT